MVKITPEEEVEIKIAYWLIQYGYKVWFNRKSKGITKALNHEPIVFKTTNRKKPDLIVLNYQTKKFFAIELKKSEHSKEIFGSHKILDYYNDYCFKNNKYFVEGYSKNINISVFLVATDTSPDGSIFKEDIENNNIFENKIKHSNSKGAVWAVENNKIPPFEFEHSHKFVRILWDFWKERKPNVGIGILLSTFLLNKTSKEPLFFYQQSFPTYKNKKGYRWTQLIES